MEIPHTEENRAKMMRVADILTGTCKSLDDVLQEVFENEDLTTTDFSIELLQELDNQTMECQGCNWWCETHELDDDQVCDDCR